jgi:hypothetical protein
MITTIAVRRLNFVGSLGRHDRRVLRSRFAPNPLANSLGSCAAHLRISSGSSEGAPHIFGSRAFWMVGKSHLPVAERKASVKKQTTQRPPTRTHNGCREGRRSTCRSGCPSCRPSRVALGTFDSCPTQCEDEDGGPKTKVLAKVSRQSRTVAGSTEGRKRSRSSSSRREESREESTETTTATAAGIGICSSSVRRSAPRRQQLGQRGGTATSTPSLWHGML